jgi:PAS domain S-box-containing protein
MPAFRDLPIRSKLTAVILLTSTAVLLLAGLAFTTYEYITFKRSFLQDVTTLSAITAENIPAAIMFDNPEDAQRLLDALRFDRKVTHAVLYQHPGKVFASFPRDAEPDEFPATPPALGSRYTAEGLIVCVDVQERGKSVGTLYVQADLDPVYARLRLYILITVGILIIAFVAAWLFSAGLRDRISRPIQDLADATRIVSQKNNYSLRVPKHSNDELGELTESFNRMLGRIEESDRELRKNQERLRLALDASQIGTWDLDVVSSRVYWDEYMGPLFGLKRGASINSIEEFFVCVHPDDRVAVRETLARALMGRNDFSAEFRVVWPDGTVRYLTSRGRAYAEGEKLSRMTGVCVDITQSKRSEEEIRRLNEELEQRVVARTAELAAANKELESFTYSVSHDLRAPLRHVNGFAQMLEEEFGATLPAEARRLLGRIRFGAQNMGNLVDDLLRLARVGRQELARRRTPLSDLVTQVVGEVKMESDGRQIEWRISALPAANCDVGLVRQVFANLLSNAVKYTRTRPTAVIEVGSEQRDGTDVFYVRDNGVGFDMKYSDKLFGVFQRLHRPDEFEGTGVGLAIVQRIVNKHGGRIWCEAAVDAGATFFFTLGEAQPSVTKPPFENAAT